MDNFDKKKIINWIEKNLVDIENPRVKGKPLSNNLKGGWRYRVENYRVIVQINDKEILILYSNPFKIELLKII